MSSVAVLKQKDINGFFVSMQKNNTDGRMVLPYSLQGLLNVIKRCSISLNVAKFGDENNLFEQRFHLSYIMVQCQSQQESDPQALPYQKKKYELGPSRQQKKKIYSRLCTNLCTQQTKYLSD